MFAQIDKAHIKHPSLRQERRYWIIHDVVQSCGFFLLRWYLYQYCIKCLIIRYREISKPRDSCLELFDPFEIWHASPQLYTIIHTTITVVSTASWDHRCYDSIYRRSKVSVQNSQAGRHDESRHNFKVVYIHQLGHYASLLSVLLFNRF